MWFELIGINESSISFCFCFWIWLCFFMMLYYAGSNTPYFFVFIKQIYVFQWLLFFPAYPLSLLSLKSHTLDTMVMIDWPDAHFVHINLISDAWAWGWRAFQRKQHFIPFQKRLTYVLRNAAVLITFVSSVQ